MIDIDNYNRGRRHASPLHEHGGLVYGFWMVGNNYRNPTRYYGAYPPGYLEKMRLLFPEPFSSGRVLHLFSGMTEVLRPDIEITMDINPDLCPDIVGNAESLSDHADALVEAYREHVIRPNASDRRDQGHLCDEASHESARDSE